MALARPLRGDRSDRGDPARRRRVRRHALLVRRDALVHRRARVDHPAADARRRRRSSSTGRGRTCRFGGVDWPLFAIFGGIATGVSFAVILVQNPATRWVGLGWLAVGLAGYVVYRRRVGARASSARRSRRRPRIGPALALEYRRLLVPIVPGQASDDAFDVAASLAAERGAQIVAVHVLEVPLELPLRAELPEQEALANRELDEARAIGDSYGVAVIPRLVRGRSAGAAIVEEAERRGTEIIVVGAPRKDIGRRKRAVFGETVDYVLKNAPCRVMVTASTEDVMKLYRGVVALLALLFVGIGVALLAVTAANGRRRARLPARRPLRRARRRAADAAPEGRPLDGPQAERLPARARRARALLGRLRRDRVLALLRARDRRRATRSASRRSSCSSAGSSSCSSRSRMRRGRPRSRRPAAPRPSCGGRSTTSSAS